MAIKDFLRSIHSVVNRLAVVAVVTVFCGIFVFPLFYNTKDAKAAKSELAALGKALSDYHAENGAWPAAGARSVAEALSGAGGGKAFTDHGRRADDGRLLDPWGNPFRFFFSSNRYAIQCAGADGEFEDGLGKGGDDYWYAPR